MCILTEHAWNHNDLCSMSGSLIRVGCQDFTLELQHHKNLGDKMGQVGNQATKYALQNGIWGQSGRIWGLNLKTSRNIGSVKPQKVGVCLDLTIKHVLDHVQILEMGQSQGDPTHLGFLSFWPIAR